MEIKYFRRDFLYTDDNNVTSRNVIYYRVINDLHRGGINTKFKEISKSKDYCTAELVKSDGDVERECTPLEIEWIEHSMNTNKYVPFDQFKIEEAQRRYPIGTHFCYAHLNNVSNKNIGIIVSDNFKLIDDNIYNLTTDGKKFNCNKLPGHSLTTDCYDRIIYNNNKWADIVETPFIFKVNDYVVCLDTPININTKSGYRTDGGCGFIPNMCLKIKNIDNYNSCDIYDNYQVLWFDEELYGIYSNSVRPATPNEIENHNKIGTYNITYLKLNTDKKYKISELIKTSKDIIVYIGSREEYDILKEYKELNICDYHGAYYYSLSDCEYSSSSCKTNSGAFGRDKTMVLFEEIDFDILNSNIEEVRKLERDNEQEIEEIEEVKEPEKSKVYHAVQVYSEEEYNIVLDTLELRSPNTRFKGPGSCISLITDENVEVIKGYVEPNDVYYTHKNLNIIQFEDWIKQHLEYSLITGIIGMCTNPIYNLHDLKKDEKLPLLSSLEEPDKMVKVVSINVVKLLNIED